MLEITGYSQYPERLGERRCRSVTSPVFAVGGHDWRIHFYPGGISWDIDFYKDYVAVYLSLESKDWDARVRASFKISRSGGRDGIFAAVYLDKDTRFL